MSAVCTCVNSIYFLETVVSRVMCAPPSPILSVSNLSKFCRADEGNEPSGLCAFHQLVFRSAFLCHLCIDSRCFAVLLSVNFSRALPHLLPSLACWALGTRPPCLSLIAEFSSLLSFVLGLFLRCHHHTKRTLFL